MPDVWNSGDIREPQEIMARLLKGKLMKRLSPPLEAAPNFSESLHQQLNTYALAASAAGVSLLALAQPSEAKIIYTHADVVIGRNQHRAIDLNHDGIPDVVIVEHALHLPIRSSVLLAEPAQGNGIEEGKGSRGSSGWAAALKAGANIGYTQQFNQTSALMAFCGEFGCDGYWYYTQARYLGVKFRIKGKMHFGWARFKNSSAYGATLTGFAYETVPGKSIIAGAMRGADEDATSNPDFANPDDPGSGASLTNPIPDKSQPASLGMLALGAHGVPLWRRKESALEGDLKGALL
jgi:hypothetical protein